MDLVTQLFRVNRYLNILAQNAPLSVARMEVLRLIKHQNPITLRQLCDIQQVTMPTMSKLVDELQLSGLIIRAQSKDDARQRLIVPTQRGIQTLLTMERQYAEFWQHKLKELTNEQQAEITTLLTHLADSLKPTQIKAKSATDKHKA